VIIFMYSHTAVSFSGRKVFSGASFRSRWRIPVSVATMNRSAEDARASRIIPPVERIFISGASPAAERYMHCVEQPHSGWTRNSAPGSASSASRISAGPIPAWTWHSPIHTCIFRPVTCST